VLAAAVKEKIFMRCRFILGTFGRFREAIKRRVLLDRGLRQTSEQRKLFLPEELFCC
jgi:hypothetical protein